MNNNSTEPSPDRDSRLSHTFYDAHMHAYNLSHPSLGAMLFRIFNTIGPKQMSSERSWLMKIVIIVLSSFRYGNRGPLFLFVGTIISIVVFLPVMITLRLSSGINASSLAFSLAMAMVFIGGLAYVLRKFIRSLENLMKSAGNAINLLFVMDYPLGEYFLELEREMIGGRDTVFIHVKEYDKIAISPMMMDFSGEHDGIKDKFRDMDERKRLLIDVPNYLPKDKPFILQEFDLLQGISTYYKESKRQLLAFYPFRGIEFHEGMNRETLNRIYYEHFLSLPMNGEERRKKIAEDLHRFPANASMFHKVMIDSPWDPKLIAEIQRSSLDCCVYAGFKVYGPLGFDAWPSDSDKRDMMITFYTYCITKEIPIMNHCGGPDAGTVNNDDYKLLTSPKRWEQVLEYTDDKGHKPFNKLKICFGHYGGLPHDEKEFQKLDKDSWPVMIVSMMDKYPNIYADISCYCSKESAYQDVYRLIEIMADKAHVDGELIRDRTIFGTDFPMTCFSTRSYKDYIGILSNEQSMEVPADFIKRICVDNPRKYMFGD